MRIIFTSYGWILALAIMALTLGCASGPVISKILFEDESRLVRLDVTYRTGGQEHSHPVSLHLDALAASLEVMTVKGRVNPLSGRLGTMPSSLTQAFSDTQVHFFAPLLAQAFERASPLEEMVFYVIEPRGSGIQEISSGSFFVQGDELHLILANYRYAVAGNLMAENVRANPLMVLGESWYNVNPGPHGRVESSDLWKGVTESAPQHLVMRLLKEGRPVDRAPDGAMSHEGLEGSPQPTSVAEKLRLLRELQESGLLTPQEFETKQRQVLDSETLGSPP